MLIPEDWDTESHRQNTITKRVRIDSKTNESIGPKIEPWGFPELRSQGDKESWQGKPRRDNQPRRGRGKAKTCGVLEAS